MRARQFLVVILIAFAAASAIAALTTIRQMRLETSERPFSELRNAPSSNAATSAGNGLGHSHLNDFRHAFRS
jgi:hypothetical protein